MKTLKYGDKGEQVARLQNKLNEHGAKISIDGDFGVATEKAVLVYQQSQNLPTDGIVGIKTWQALHGEPTAHLLSQADYERAADELGVPVPVIIAFAKVESAGSGFIGVGKPKILFERHKMYAHLKQKHGLKVADKYAKSHPNIVSKSTGGYQGGMSEWVRLNHAKTLDQDCAYMSASFGQFQIMGENWQLLGYESVQDFVAKMSESERHQLDAFVRFIQSKKGLKEALQKADWDKVFTLYNGKNYKKLGYDVKFARELRRLELLSS